MTAPASEKVCIRTKKVPAEVGLVTSSKANTIVPVVPAVSVFPVAFMNTALLLLLNPTLNAYAFVNATPSFVWVSTAGVVSTSKPVGAVHVPKAVVQY